MSTSSILIIRPNGLSSLKKDPASVQVLFIRIEKQGPGKIVSTEAPVHSARDFFEKAFESIGLSADERPSATESFPVILEPGLPGQSGALITITEKICQQMPGFRLHVLSKESRVMANDPWLPQALLAAYNEVKVLPGIPLWQLLQYADTLDILLAAMKENGWEEKKAALHLSRIRSDKALSLLQVTGDKLEYHFEPPSRIPLDLMEDIVRMVAAGGSVDITHVRSNLGKAYLIGYVMENGVIVGDSSLKHPRQAFIDRLKGFTGLDFTGCVERGYTSVRPEYRSLGIGTRLLEGLTARATDVLVYSIIDEKNIAAQKMAIHNNTRQIAAYFSEKVQKNMGVWMPEKMADLFLARQKGGSDKC